MRIADEQFLEVEPLVFERELAVQISKLIVHSGESLGKQMASLQPKRKRVGEINLKCEVELRRFLRETEVFDLLNQKSEKGLLRFLLGTSGDLGRWNEREIRRINQRARRPQMNPENYTRSLAHFYASREKIDSGLNSRDAYSSRLRIRRVDGYRDFCIV